MTDAPQPKIIEKSTRIAGNRMFQLIRRSKEIEIQDNDVENLSEEECQTYLESGRHELLPEFENHIARKIEIWASHLDREDLPHPLVPIRVVIADDDDVPVWAEVTNDEVRNVIVGIDASESVKLGSEYIELVSEPFSLPWWLNRLCMAGGRLLNSEDENARKFIAVELGRCEREFEIFVNESEAVETGHKTKDERKRGGGHNRRVDYDRIVEVMMSYIDSGHSVSNAARMAHERDNLGTNPGANRTLYNSHMKRLKKNSEGR